jgi:hypothetical protein
MATQTLVTTFPDRLEVKVFFSYMASVIPPKCRLHRPVEMHDGQVTVTIPRVAKEDAPVAIVSTDSMTSRESENYPWKTVFSKKQYKFWNKQHISHKKESNM